MSDRKDFYFRQRVSESELDSAFADLEDADHHLAGDLGIVGVLDGAVVSPHAPVADLTVDVSGPGTIFDQLGQRVFFSATQTVNVAADDNGVSTEVSAAGKERVVSVFVQFDRALSDPRIDGNSLTVFFERAESFKFTITQGAEAAAGAAVPPALRPDAILLADVTRQFGQAQVVANAISSARRQDVFVLAGAPRSIRRGRTSEALADLLDFYDAHVGATADRHTAAAIDYAGGVAWADGTTNPGGTVAAQIDKLLTDLSAAQGAGKIGAAATAGAPAALRAGTVKSQLDALLAGLNAHVGAPAAAHAASAIAYTGGGPWKDDSPNPPATVADQLSKVVSDLVADAGAARIGVGARPDWLDGRKNAGGVSVLAALAKLVADLVDQTADTDGAGRIGAAAAGRLPAGSVRSQLDALDATAVRTNVVNTFAATQVVNGADGDVNAAIATTVVPATRKLLWEIAGAAGTTWGVRLYATAQAFEITLNAKWDGAQWTKDFAAVSSKLELTNSQLLLHTDDALASPFPDAWASTVSVQLANHGAQTFDGGANWTSAGPTEAYLAWRCANGLNVIAGGGATFRKVFPALPSSITFIPLETFNLTTPLVAFHIAASGTGATANVGGAANNTYCFARVIAS